MSVPRFLALLVVALAAYRLTRVVVEDSITESFRRWVWKRAYVPGGYDAQRDRMTVERRGDRIGWAWEKAYQLVTCPFCFGWWVTIAVWLAWFGWPSRARDVVELAATIGLQAFISSRPNA